MQYLFDSNILIYHLNGYLNERGSELLEEGILGEGAYSTISKIELLGFQQPEVIEAHARELLADLLEIPISSEIAEQTIEIRKAYKIKLPDAVIAATALTSKLKLVTRNSKDFAQIAGIILVNPFEENQASAG
jgi:predicted nucleic acid-binding protein